LIIVAGIPRGVTDDWLSRLGRRRPAQVPDNRPAILGDRTFFGVLRVLQEAPGRARDLRAVVARLDCVLDFT